MNFNRRIVVCILAIACVAASDDSLLSHQPRRSLLFFPPIFSVPKPSSNNKPFSIFSRPPDKNDEPHKGQTEDDSGGIISHVGNVLHGGSIRIEIRPLAPLQGILDHAKKFIPGHGTVGRPNHERPSEELPHYEPPHQDRPNYEKPHEDRPNYERPHEDRPNYDRPHHERPKYEYPKQEKPPHHEQPDHFERPHQQRPGHHQRPNKDHPRPGIFPQPPKKEDEIEWETNKKDPQPGPQWEDIGEVPSIGEEDYGEGVLQPRRPKRFVESKIYHVPLLFRSNGRADRVRIKSRNELIEKTSEI